MEKFPPNQKITCRTRVPILSAPPSMHNFSLYFLYPSTHITIPLPSNTHHHPLIKVQHAQTQEVRPQTSSNPPTTPHTTTKLATPPSPPPHNRPTPHPPRPRPDLPNPQFSPRNPLQDLRLIPVKPPAHDDPRPAEEGRGGTCE